MFMMSGGRNDEDKLRQLIVEERSTHEKIRNLRSSWEREQARLEQRYKTEIERYEQKVLRIGREIEQLERLIARYKK